MEEARKRDTLKLGQLNCSVILPLPLITPSYTAFPAQGEIRRIFPASAKPLA